MKGVTRQELYGYAAGEGAVLPLPGDQDRAVACKVLVVGWSWAVFMAHMTLPDRMEVEFSDLDAGCLQQGAPVSDFTLAKLIYW